MTRTQSPPRAQKLLTIDLGADLKTSWYQWCAEHNLVPGKAARHLIETRLKEAPEQAQAPHASALPWRRPGSSAPAPSSTMASTCSAGWPSTTPKWTHSG